MTILGLQRRLREVGRIRLGEKVTTPSGKKRPAKLDRFRLTARDEQILVTAALRWGGTVRPWESPDGPQFELVTETTELPVIVPPGEMSFSQHYELWSAAGCQKRCNGQWDVVRDVTCDCDPSDRECNIHTRLSVLLPDLPALGVWRLESKGYYAAVELAGAVDVCQQAAAAGKYLPARLSLEPRSANRVDANGKPVTLRFVVPVLNVEIQLRAALDLMAPTDEPVVTPVIPPPPPTPETTWTPVGELPAAPFVSVADQLADTAKPVSKPRRKNAATPIKPTGLTPSKRISAQAVCGICAEPYGDQPVVRNPQPGPRFVHRTCLDNTDTDADVGDDTDLGSRPSSGRGGMSNGADDSAEPVPPTPLSKPTAPQTRKLFALVNEVFDVSEALSSTDAEAVRRSMLLDLCAWLGAPDLGSRADIDRGTARKAIDALQAIKDGDWTWDGGLYDTATGAEVRL